MPRHGPTRVAKYLFLSKGRWNDSSAPGTELPLCSSFFSRRKLANCEADFRHGGVLAQTGMTAQHLEFAQCGIGLTRTGKNEEVRSRILIHILPPPAAELSRLTSSTSSLTHYICRARAPSPQAASSCASCRSRASTLRMERLGFSSSSARELRCTSSKPLATSRCPPTFYKALLPERLQPPAGRRVSTFGAS